MAQKINPIALRLDTNLNFDSCWYNNSNYVNLLIRDLKVKNYINNILKKSKLCHARFHILSLHNKQKINVFFCNPASARSEMLVSLRVKDGNTNTKMSLKPSQLNSSLINKNFPAFSKIINLEKARLSSDLACNSTSVPTAQTKSCTDAFLWKTSCKNLGNPSVFSGEPSFLTGNEHTNVYLQTKYSTKQASVINKLTQLLTCRETSNYILFLINKQYSRKTHTDYLNLSRNSIKHTQNFSVSHTKNYLTQLLSQTKNPKKPLELNKSLPAAVATARNFISAQPQQRIYLVQNTFSWKQLVTILLKTGVYKTHIQSVIHETFQSTDRLAEASISASAGCQLQFFKTANIFQSAEFLCNEIVYYLEKKVPFFKLKNIVLRLLLTHQTKCKNVPVQFAVKGIRVMCSGVVPGKSKKSQKSKIQSFKYGETSLHVFSCKIDFKSKTAYTNFGTLGIKVWVCYT